MKTTLSVISAMVMYAFCTQVSTAAELATKRDYCLSQTKLAQSIMRKRQEGASISDMLAVMPKGSSPSNPMHKIYIATVEFAYKLPAYSSERFQHKAVIDFGTMVYLTCIDSNIKDFPNE